MKNSKLTIGLVIILAIVCINGCSAYNNLVTMSEGVDQAWAKVENQYQRRFDLIPNLVNTVKAYAKHESETLQGVTNSRAGIQPQQDANARAGIQPVDSATQALSAAYNNAQSLREQANANDDNLQRYATAQHDLNRALNVYVNAVHEAYPDLKANENFRDLQTQLEGTENRIATERKAYTEQVQQYNLAARRFPGNIWANIFGFDTKPQFHAEEAAQKSQRVEF